MPRPDRLDYPGALHHAINRGVRGMDIMRFEDERSMFRELLNRYSREYDMTILAYCLMDNHYHLILESQSGRISAFMETFQSRYAQWFNQNQESTNGHLFQNRFKNYLIEEGSYFNEVVRYVLLNPHRAGLCPPDRVIHNWTSMRGWGEEEGIADWSRLFELMENVKPDQFLDFLREGSLDEEEIESDQRRVRDVRVVGSDDFLEEMLERQESETRGDEREGPVDPEFILDSVCEHTNFEDRSELLETQNDRANSSIRYAAYYLLRIRSHCSLNEIGDLFEVSESAVSYGLEEIQDSDRWTRSIEELWNEWDVEF